MTDQDAPNPPAAEAPDPGLGEQDWFLATIVKMVNDADLEMSVTLTVGGTTISGGLISVGRYFDLYADQIVGALPADTSDEERRSAGAPYREIGERYHSSPSKDKPPRYIHLSDAKIISPGNHGMPVEGLLWRGRLAQVGGFALGRLARAD